MNNKKGVFFTFVAIVLAAVIVFSFTAQTTYRLKDKMNVIEARVSTLNSFFDDVQKDLSRGLYISGFRALLAMGEYIDTEGVYIDDVDKRFEEAMINGTVNLEVIDVIKNQTFVDWAEKIKVQALKIGIDANISIINLSLYHVDSWNVAVSAYVDIRVNDTKGTASFSKVKEISSTIGIEGFEDPLYVINSNGRVFNTVVKTDVADFNNVSQLKRHLNYSYYIASSSAPNFLMRLEGNLSNSTFGIESLVNINDFTQQGVSATTKSHVDYIYFSNQSPSFCVVNETQSDSSFSWFRLDEGHLPVYGAACS